MGRFHQRPAAFSLIELLVVISVTTLMISLLLPALRQARDAGRSAHCLANERQQAVALAAYIIEFANYTPPAHIQKDYISVYLPSYGSNDAFINDSWLLGQYTGNGTGMQQKAGRLVSPRSGAWYCPAFGGLRLLTPNTYGKYAPAHRVFILLKEDAGWSELWRMSQVAKPSALLFTADAGEREHWEPGEPVPTPYYGITDVDAEIYHYGPPNPSPLYVRNRRLRHNGNTTTNFSFVDGHAATIANPTVEDQNGNISIDVDNKP